jgi:HAD superfamily hydrolase (TIGR01484 family)
MIVFNTDLDNTIIYSHKRNIGQNKKCVEIYEGREVSYMTHKTEILLQAIQEHCLFVPTTTRTTEQYHRIQLGIGVPEYALTCNGGVLLKKDEFQEDWYQDSLKLIENCTDELQKAEYWLERDENRSMEVRNIEKLFIFTKSNQPKQTIAELRKTLDTSLVDVFHNGVKVYVVPKQLNKGMAVNRLRKLLHPDYVIAAGDSEFDISMLKAADLGIAHPELFKTVQFDRTVITMPEQEVFSDALLTHIVKNYP